MDFDLRFPIGLLFSFYGLLLSIFGAVSTNDSELYRRSLNININLIWGVVMLLFGAVMLWLAWRARAHPPGGGK